MYNENYTDQNAKFTFAVLLRIKLSLLIKTWIQNNFQKTNTLNLVGGCSKSITSGNDITLFLGQRFN